MSAWLHRLLFPCHSPIPVRMRISPLTLTAPNSLGTYRGNFVIKNPAGLIMKVNQDFTSVAGHQCHAGTADRHCSSRCTHRQQCSRSDHLHLCILVRSGQDHGNDQCHQCLSGAKQSARLHRQRQLAKAAQSHANDMACNTLTGHTGSNGSTPKSRVTDAGYTYSLVSENI